MKRYEPTVEGFHDALWDHVKYLDMSDINEHVEAFRVDVGLKFSWWVYWVPFLKGRLLKKARIALDRVRPAHIAVNVFPAYYGLRGWNTRKG